MHGISKLFASISQGMAVRHSALWGRAMPCRTVHVFAALLQSATHSPIAGSGSARRATLIELRLTIATPMKMTAIAIASRAPSGSL